MGIIFVLIGISLSMATLFLTLFIKSVRSKQFDDTYTPSIRILIDNNQFNSTSNSNTTNP